VAQTHEIVFVDAPCDIEIPKGWRLVEGRVTVCGDHASLVN
jgi:hypothetical protein